MFGANRSIYIRGKVLPAFEGFCGVNYIVFL